MKLSFTEILFLYGVACFSACTLGRLYSLYQEEHPQIAEYKPYIPKPYDYKPAVIHQLGDGNIGIGYPLYWDGTFVDGDNVKQAPTTTCSFYWDEKFQIWVPEGTAIGYQQGRPVVTGSNQTFIGQKPISHD